MRLLPFVGAAALLGAFARPAHCAASLTRVGGVVEVRRSGSENWDLHVATSARRFGGGDRVRTGRGASAVLALDGAALLAVGPASEAVLSGSTARPIVELVRGRARVVFGGGASALRLSVAVGSISARAAGTVARVELSPSGAAVVEVAQGVVVIEDARGVQLAVHAGERLRLDARGAGSPDEAPAEGGLERERWRARARRELLLDRAREGVLVSAARDARLGELRQGRALMDSRGARVRVEQYVVRPTADSVRLVTLNARAGRFDAFSLLGVFDRSLPTELSAALRELSGTADAAPAYVMTSYETLRTNGTDAVVERAEGGHAVDLNANADPTDDVTSLFDPGSARMVDVAGRGVFKTLYDRYGLYIDGTLKRGWRGSAVESYDPAEAVPSAASGLDPISGAPTAVFARASSASFPDPALAHRVVYESYADGTFIQWDMRSTTPDGEVGSRAPNYTLGTLELNFEQTVQSSEMGGRRIELVLPASIPAAAGLLP